MENFKIKSREKFFKKIILKLKKYLEQVWIMRMSVMDSN
jgi:hypothetical protein